jgi:hypothetical protein
VETQNRYFFYGQDTYRATRKLTINYGLRWEHYTPEFVNGKGNGGFAVLPEGVIRVAGYGGISMNGNTRADWKNFAPRLGIAYQATQKTVVRMGYGRSFDLGVFGSLFGHTVTQNLPVLAHQTLNSATGDNKTPAYNFTGQCLAAPYDPTICGPQSGAAAFPLIPSSGILPFYGPCLESQANTPNCVGNVQPKSRPDHFVLPTVDAWNLTVQHQLTNKSSFEIGYVANHGSHTFKGNGPSYNANQPTVVGFPTIPYNNRAPYVGAFSTPYTFPDGTTTTVFCCNGSQSFDYRGNDGTNSYESLQMRYEQRPMGGLTVSAFYTYSKAYDNDGSYQPDPRQGWGRQDYNRDSVLIFTSLYELPIGRGKHFMGNMSRAADLLLGGWQWNTTVTLGSGLPFSPSYNECNQDRDTGPCRPSKQGSFHMGSGPLVNNQVVYFTPVAPLATNGATSGVFVRPQVAQFGNIRRNAFTGPGEFMSDMSIFKNFSITERVKAQFQAEFFNVFNHPVYNNPGNTCIDCSGGGLITSLLYGTSMRQMQLGARITF